jgi:predicted dinucleotide-binding enzyme
MQNKKYKIVLIGSGNVAFNLGFAFRKAGHKIVEVVSRNAKTGPYLARKINAQLWIKQIKNINTDADIYVIAVNDDSIYPVIKQLKLKLKNNPIVVHTSGTVYMNELQMISTNYGVIYPVQTMTLKNADDFKTTPVCFEASNSSTLRKLKRFAESISNNVMEIDSDDRKTIHLAAVFANNFTNHLFTIAENILAKKNISFDILKPLIAKTILNLVDNSPIPMQTGPAVRGDNKTMKSHIAILSDDQDYQNIYKSLSKSIIKSSKKNK